MSIDLHTHTSVSDGTDTPSELIAHARRVGLSVLAITDHDTTDGWAEAADAAAAQGISLVRGIEISTEHEGGSVHVLGYLVDPDHAGLAGELERSRTSRDTRLQEMTERLAADGIPIAYADVLDQLGPGATPGRPHLADALMARGVVADRTEAFERYLNDASPYYVRHYAPDTVEAVRLVLLAGGVPVLAHPFAAARRSIVTEALVEQLADAGLVGIEVDHPEQDDDARRRACRVARSCGLVVTGSSDYHGAGKVNRLGECTSRPEALERIEASASGVPVLWTRG